MDLGTKILRRTASREELPTTFCWHRVCTEFKNKTIKFRNRTFELKPEKMDIETRKISFVQEFLRLQNEEIISELENFLRKRKAELIEENMKPMTMDQYNDEIDRAMEDSKNGRMIKATDLKEKIRKWD